MYSMFRIKQLVKRTRKKKGKLYENTRTQYANTAENRQKKNKKFFPRVRMPYKYNTFTFTILISTWIDFKNLENIVMRCAKSKTDSS